MILTLTHNDVRCKFKVDRSHMDNIYLFLSKVEEMDKHAPWSDVGKGSSTEHEFSLYFDGLTFLCSHKLQRMLIYQDKDVELSYPIESQSDIVVIYDILFAILNLFYEKNTSEINSIMKIFHIYFHRNFQKRKSNIVKLDMKNLHNRMNLISELGLTTNLVNKFFKKDETIREFFEKVEEDEKKLKYLQDWQDDILKEKRLQSQWKRSLNEFLEKDKTL